MTTEISSKRPASVMRQLTQPVRDHSAAALRIIEQWRAAVERANAQYFDGMKRITDAIIDEQSVHTAGETSTEATVSAL
jgi:uridine kinase